MNLYKYVSDAINETSFAKTVFDEFSVYEKFGEFADTAKTNWDSLMVNVYSDDPNSPKPIKFFKTEIDSVLKVITNIAGLKVNNSAGGGSGSTAPLKARLNEELPDEPFEYKDYDSFLEAIINLFDGWINTNDIPGSLLSLDSRVAPYFSELFKCLKPLDESEIVYALGVPFLTNKLSEFKETTKDFIDLDICIDQINSNNSLFTDISNFFNQTTIKNLQHMVTGLFIDSAGKFNTDVFSNPKDILGKLNEKLIIVHDDPATAANETSYDAQPLKYYLIETLKSFYNFEIFNPKSGPNKNLNIHHIFDFMFVSLESFGVEVPSSTVYDKLDSSNKWENEFTAMIELLAVIGKNNLLNISDYSSDINSALLYSLAGETAKASTYAEYRDDMPTNLGEVLGSVGDSVVFSTVMGSLLDNYLEGTLCDSSLGVCFSNIEDGTYWHQEGENMNDLLCNIAQLDLDLKNIDLTAVTDIVGLNEMLHSLSNSLIFKDDNTNRFGEWLYSKASGSLDSFAGGLLDDPDDTIWNPEWDNVVKLVDNSEYPTQKIAYYDFVVRNGALPNDYEENKAGWSCSDFETKNSVFKESKNFKSLTRGEICDLYKDSAFMDDYYNSVLKYDELGRLVNVLANGMIVLDGGSSIDFSNISSENLGNLLTSINNTNCLRISTYNAMKLAKDSIGSNDFVDINKANFEYLILADAGLLDYELGRANRQTEIDHIVNFYGDYKEIQNIAGDSLDSSAFFNKAKMKEMLGVDDYGNNDPLSRDYLSNLLAELESSKCFNLYTVENRQSDELSFFEDRIVNLMDTSGIKDLSDVSAEQMAQRARKISYLEYDGVTNTDGYNSSWVERDINGDISGGEVSSITGVLKSIVGITSGDTIDANSLSVSDLSADDASQVLKSINGSFMCDGVISHLMKDAFSGGMGLENYLKFDSSDAEMVANFNLSYLDFGGVDNNCGIGTEIYNIKTVISAMQYEDPISHDLVFISIGDLQDALNNKSDCLDGIFYYLYNSKTLDKTITRNSIEIKGRSVLLYNALSNFDSYLIGNNKEDKIASLDKIFAVSEQVKTNAYQIEANGISRIIDAAGNSISGITVDNLRNDSATKEMILNTIKFTYDRNDGNTKFTLDTNVTKGRSYFASAIISGIFDDVLSSEYDNIDSNFTASRISNFSDYRKFYFASKVGGGKASCANDITATTFDNLNEIEKNGLDGMIQMTEYVNGDADRSGATISSIASNPFVVGMTANSIAIRNLFDTKLHSNGEDSRMAKVLFISRGAETIEKETTYADDTVVTNSGLFVMLKYATNIISNPTSVASDYIWKATEGYTDDYYGSEFNFGVYGNKLMDYIDSCHP